MSQREEHERYLREVIFANSLSSENPSEETYLKALKNSSLHFQRYKEELIRDYQGKSLLDIEGSKNHRNSSGETIKITNKQKIDFNLINNNFKDKLTTNLKLIEGIGPKKELKLKKQGYTTLDSLKSHDNYSNKASKIINIIDNASFCEILDLLNKNKYSKDCKNNLIRCASLVERENFKFMDIETLGLSNLPIILIGVAEIKNKHIITTQYLLKDKLQEEAVLEGYLSHLDENSVHVTFNGATFDIPYIKNRCNYYRLDSNIDLPHLDLIVFARHLWKDCLPDCKLQTIEENFFNLKRVGDVPGKFIPDYYESYLEFKNIGPLVPIIDHNRQDVISLANFLMKMYGEV